MGGRWVVRILSRFKALLFPGQSNQSTNRCVAAGVGGGPKRAQGVGQTGFSQGRPVDTLPRPPPPPPSAVSRKCLSPPPLPPLFSEVTTNWPTIPQNCAASSQAILAAQCSRPAAVLSRTNHEARGLTTRLVPNERNRETEERGREREKRKRKEEKGKKSKREEGEGGKERVGSPVPLPLSFSHPETHHAPPAATLPGPAWQTELTMK